MKQSEKAAYWIEYVIRNGGDSLKSPAIEFSLCQLLLLDVYGFVAIILILITLGIILSIKLLLSRLTKSSDKSNGTKKRKIQ